VLSLKLSPNHRSTFSNNLGKPRLTYLDDKKTIDIVNMDTKKSLSLEAPEQPEKIPSENGEVTSSIAIDPKAERAVVWKFDLRLLPVLAVMYLFNSLDKSNLGNAKTAGLEASLGLVDNQYNILLSVFFVPYVLTAPFLGILGKKYGPSRVLPCMMFVFGCCTLLVVATKNFGGIMALRWFLGMSESAFFPLVIYYQTMYVAS
jgi:hypothetical protein